MFATMKRTLEKAGCVEGKDYEVVSNRELGGIPRGLFWRRASKFGVKALVHATTKLGGSAGAGVLFLAPNAGAKIAGGVILGASLLGEAALWLTRKTRSRKDLAEEQWAISQKMGQLHRRTQTSTVEGAKKHVALTYFGGKSIILNNAARKAVEQAFPTKLVTEIFQPSQ